MEPKNCEEELDFFPVKSFNVELVRFDGSEEDIISAAMLTKGLEINEKIQKKRFIKNLLLQKHMTPFEFTRICFKIRCSRACHSQFLQYRTAVRLTRSLRFALPLEIIQPELVNSLPDDFKKEYIKKSLEEYTNQINKGVAREDARAILPLGIQTEFLWYQDLRNLLHFFDERIHNSAQSEIRSIARYMLGITEFHYPNVIKAWAELKNHSED